MFELGKRMTCSWPIPNSYRWKVAEYRTQTYGLCGIVNDDCKLLDQHRFGVSKLIGTMSPDNVGCGIPRLHDGLRLLGSIKDL